MKRIATGAGMVVVGLVVVVGLSSRPLADLFGYARATADTTVSGLETNLPESVRDQKVQNQLEDARGELIDRRVSLSLAAGQIRDLQGEVSRLTSAIEVRRTILADAWPAMEAAAADRSQPVQFAGRGWQPDELGAEVDRLLSEQDRDEVQLQVRSEALARLEHSVQESQSAVSDMDTRLQQAQTDFELLKMRREQAQSESDLLDLLATAGSSGDSTTGRLAGDLSALEQQVREREARNNARRESAPLSETRPSRLTQSWERLERLKQLHEQRQPAIPVPTGASTPTPAPLPTPAPQ
jgi:chromosome segregation ATPase